MRTQPEIALPSILPLSPYFSDEINRRIVQSEVEGGVYLRDLQRGQQLEIETQDWVCTLVYCGDNEAFVSGHPRFCPAPVRVTITGSTWGGSMLKQHFVGRGMHLEFIHPRYERVLTAPIIDIRGSTDRPATAESCHADARMSSPDAP